MAWGWPIFKSYKIKIKNLYFLPLYNRPPLRMLNPCALFCASNRASVTSKNRQMSIKVAQK